MPAGEDQAVGREEAVIAQGACRGGGRARGVTVPVGLAWLSGTLLTFAIFGQKALPASLALF